MQQGCLHQALDHKLTYCSYYKDSQRCSYPYVTREALEDTTGTITQGHTALMTLEVGGA